MPDDYEDPEIEIENLEDLEDLGDVDLEEVEEVITIAPAKKINYLNNKDMLKEIHKSKNSFCEYVSPEYSDYDVIVEDIEHIFHPEVQERAKITKAARRSVSAFEAAVANNTDTGKTGKLKLAEFRVLPDTVSVDELVFRVLTFDHIPPAPGRKKNPKSVADRHIKLNFFPFKHYVIENGVAKEVGRSHTKKGKFSLDHGSVTGKLAKMFILMVNKYAQRGNWRGYTYLDEMKGQALLQLAQMGLQFDENKSDNPFSYYTAIISTSFTRVLNSEKKNQDLRDDLLVDRGANPSFSRQLAVEDEIRRLREEASHFSKDDT